jgi:hypothetical protein
VVVIDVVVEAGSPSAWAGIIKAAAPNGQPVVLRHGRGFSWAVAPPGSARKAVGR